MQWSDLNDKTHTLSINKAIARGKITTPKTKNSNRVIFISDSLMKLLLELKNHKDKLYGFSESFFIFSDASPLSKSTLDKRWKRYLNKSSVKHIKLHDLRHSHASHLFSLNINPLYISKRLGHKDLTITLQIYVHIAQNIIDENDEKMRILT